MKKINYKVLILTGVIFILFLLVNFKYDFSSFKIKNITLNLDSIYSKYLDMVNYKSYILENEKLTNSLILKENTLSKNKELEEEISLLKEELDLKKIYTSYDLIYSTIIIKDKISNTFTIDKGKDSLIEEGDAVITNLGLVGIVDTVYDKNSIIKPLSSFNISVKINNIYGTLSYDKDFIITDFNKLEEVYEGDLVYTTGMGNLPSGILVGKVKKIESDYYDINNIIYVDTSNIDNTLYVAVLRSK